VYRRRLLALLVASAALARVDGALADAPHAAERTQATQAAGAKCGRRCLLEMLTSYTEALTDNLVAGLPVAANVRVTSNGSVTQLGQGEVWGPARRIPYRQAFVDPDSGAAVFYGVVTDAIKPVLSPASEPSAKSAPKWWFYVVRLRVRNHKISEVEEIAADAERAPFFAADASTLHLPDRIFDSALPLAERSSRKQLFAAADKYFDAVSGKLNYKHAPWHPECQRLELGGFTVNAERFHGSCGGEFQARSMRWNVVNRRFYIADVERGVVLAIGNFMTPDEFPKNTGSVVVEVFKVQDGLIRYIQAFLRAGQLHSGWGRGAGS
jgi:hypothetical protein